MWRFYCWKLVSFKSKCLIFGRLRSWFSVLKMKSHNKILLDALNFRFKNTKSYDDSCLFPIAKSQVVFWFFHRSLLFCMRCSVCLSRWSPTNSATAFEQVRARSAPAFNPKMNVCSSPLQHTEPCNDLFWRTRQLDLTFAQCWPVCVNRFCFTYNLLPYSSFYKRTLYWKPLFFRNTD